MNRIAEFAAVVKPGSTATIHGEHPADADLLALLVHSAFADGQVDESEFALLGRLVPGKDPTELLMWVDATSRTPMDLDALLARFPDPLDRRALVALAKDMARADGVIDPGEVQLVDMLTSLVYL